MTVTLSVATHRVGCMTGKPIPVEQRFWSKVDRSGGPDACWPWVRARNADGYGRVGVAPAGTVELAHRVSWAIAHPGETVPRVVRHTCDNPPCVNPAHLLGGTHKDNTDDMLDRGRHRTPVGEAHPRAVLTEDVVRRVMRLRRTGLTYREVAEATGATPTQVADITTGRTWTHLEYGD